ncbi:MAG: hypothetical protein JNM27_18600 [Leptospirales bacterium]|nr:hypothetical protein [Leptospirales bacterium]
MHEHNSEVKRKQDFIQSIIKDKFETIAAFAIVHNLNYNRLIGTISGRDPDLACVKALITQLPLQPEQLPRLPKRWLNESKDKTQVMS